MASPPLVTYITSTAQSAESIVEHCVLSSIKLSQRKSKDFVTSETAEKLFWKLIKGQRFTSQMGAFLVDGNILTDKNKIREMWADHFESIGTPPIAQISTMDFATALLREYKKFSKPALRILRELSVSLWNMKK